MKKVPHILFFIFTVFLAFSGLVEDFGFIRSAYAETESENESDNDDIPKVNKGKGRATSSEILEQMGDNYMQKEEKSDSDLDNHIYLQEEYDKALAISLQQEEDDEFARYLQENSGEKEDKSPSSDNYSVYSSEIHSDDSENTVNKKLEVKEVEKNLKRKRLLDEDDKFETSNKKKFNND